MKAKHIKEDIDQSVAQYEGELHVAAQTTRRLLRDLQRAQAVTRDSYFKLAAMRIRSLPAQHHSASVMSLLQRREQFIETLERRLRISAQFLQEQREQHQALVDTADRLTERFEQAILDDAQAKKLVLELEAAKNRSEEAQTNPLLDDIQERIKEYASDPLFSYLWERQQRASERDGIMDRFFNRIDAWVAALSNYARNSENYALLLAAAEEAAKSNRHLEELIAEAKQALDDRIDEIEDKFEIDQQRAKVKAMKSRLDDAVADYDHLCQAKERYEKNLDQPYLEAIDALVQELKAQEPLTALIESERGTIDAIVDGLVVVQNLETRIATAQAQEKEIDKRLKKMYTFKETLDDSLRSSRRYRYDDSLDIQSLLLGYMAGQVDLGDVKASIRSHEIKLPDNSFDGFGSSSSSGSSFGSSGSFGSGSSSSSDSFGGGDYSSSDRF